MKHKFLSKKYLFDFPNPMADVLDMAKNYNDVIDLSLGDPDIITNSEIIKNAHDDALLGHTRYTDSTGDPELKYEISKYYRDVYGYDVFDNEIMVTVGACHGLYLIFQAILDEGDEVIVHEPYFTPYKQQIEMAGGKPVFIKTCEKELFSINIERLRALITNKTKAILINSPNNPTGACFSRKTLEEIAIIAKEFNLLVISDEVYDAFTFQEKFTPITTIDDMKERTITIQSFSKDYSMTGWRVGYVMAPSYIIKCIRDINEGICYSAPSISQRAAIKALKSRETIQPSLIHEYKKRISYAYDRIIKIPKLKLNPPQGSIYLFVNIKNTGLNSIEFTQKLLQESQVLVLPGTAFGVIGEGFIRIACTVGMDKLKEAFDRIEALLQ